MWNLIFTYLYDRLVENEHLYIFGFIESSLILQPGAANASVDEWVVAPANRVQSPPK